MIKKTLLLLLSATFFTFTACKPNQDTEDLYDQILNKKKITMATSADYPPFDYHALVDGKDIIMGFDVDLAAYIAEEMGVTLEINDMNFDGLMMEMENGKSDILLGGINPTEERKKRIDFSDLYLQTNMVLVTQKENKSLLYSKETLNNKVIGVQMASKMEQMIREDYPDAQPYINATVSNLMLELINGKIDGVVLENSVADAYVHKYPQLAIADIGNMEYGASGSAIGLKKGNPKLLKELNRIIQQAQEEGIIDRLYEESIKKAQDLLAD